MISVIIPAYNAEPYIDNCLRSVLSQEHAEFEVVLVNDGSTDRTGEICRTWQKAHDNIRYICQENKGQGSARNTAVAHARGEWLVFLDADDELCPCALNTLQKASCLEDDIVYYEMLFQQYGSTDAIHVTIPENIHDKESLVRESSTYLWDKMFRTDFWRQSGIQLDNIYGEDLSAIYILEAVCKNFRLLRKPLIRHYAWNDSLSSNPDKVIQITRSIEKTILEFIESGLFETYRISLFCMVCRQWQIYQSPEFCDLNQQQLQKTHRELERILHKYFWEILLLRKTEIVMIGRQCYRWYETVDLSFFKGFTRYEELEQFSIIEPAERAEYQLYIIDVLQEGRNYRFGTRTHDWQSMRWKKLTAEFFRAAIKRGKIINIFVIDRDGQNRELIRAFKENGVNQIEACFPSLLKILKTKSNFIDKREEDFLPDDKFWCRGEQFRLQYNENILHAWLRLKLQGQELITYFHKKGYKKIAIYGMGYLGERLMEDLRLSGAEFVYGIDKNHPAGVLDRYRPEDDLPETDVIVITVVHMIFWVRQEAEAMTNNTTPIVSLEEVINHLIEEGEQL